MCTAIIWLSTRGLAIQLCRLTGRANLNSIYLVNQMFEIEQALLGHRQVVLQHVNKADINKVVGYRLSS